MRPLATVAFPGHGYNRSRVRVLLRARNVIDVIVPRILESADSFS